MRKLTIIFVVAFFAQNSFSQVANFLKFTYTDKVVTNLSTQAILESYAVMKNTSSSETLLVKARRTVPNPIPGSSNYFCWDACYPTSTSISDGSIQILPGDSTNVFSGHYSPQGQSGTCAIRYCFFSESNNADSICYIATYIAGTTGIEDLETVSEGGILFPNPASGSATFKFKTQENCPHYLELIDLLGKTATKINLEKSFGEQKIDLAKFPNGIYAYHFSTLNRIISSGKLTVITN
jgi:hypothetical protein